jgi:subtilisin family serine protease
LDETDFSHPNFLGGDEWHNYYIYDHYGDEQWAMGRIFRAYSGSPDSLNHRVYEITSDLDSNIVIAVIDNGIGPHEDLPEDRLVDGYDFANMDGDPSPCNYPNLPNFHIGGHGQCVAGILGASQNREPDSINNSNTGIY